MQMQFTERVTRVKAALLRARHWSATDASKRLLNLSKVSKVLARIPLISKLGQIPGRCQIKVTEE